MHWLIDFCLRSWRVFKHSFERFNENRAGTHGAALSFYAVFALPPLLLLLVMVTTLFIDVDTIRSFFIEQAGRIAGRTGTDMVTLILENSKRPDSSSNIFAGLVSVCMVIYSATGIFAQLQDTLNIMWGVKVRPEVSIQRMFVVRLVSFALILFLGATVLITILLEVGLAVVENIMTKRFEILEQIYFFQNLNRGIFFVVLTVMFAAIFRFLPDVRVPWRGVFAGSLFTSLALSLSKFLIAWFLSTAQLGTAYGTLGSLIIFLFWLHLNMQIFLFGAEFTEAFALESGVPIKPMDYAMWLPGRTPHNRPPASM